MTEIRLTATGLSTGYKQPHTILSEDLKLELLGGELVCLLGPNGAGKSTLMRTLCGLQAPLSGRIDIMGHDLAGLSASSRARYFAVVLTERLQLGPFLVRDLVALGRHPYTKGFGALSPQDEAVIEWAMESTDITLIQNNNVNELSDGQCQRVMIARALAQEPKVLILDEPTAFLDLPGRVRVSKLLKRLARKTQTAILMSTHDLDLALSIADRLWLLDKEGVLVSGAPEDLVLGKVIEKVFHGEDILFDDKRGTFKSRQAFSGEIALQGEGLPKFWTAHALEREGFCVRDGLQGHDLSITLDAKGTTWISRFDGKEETHHSIYDLMIAVRALNH